MTTNFINGVSSFGVPVLGSGPIFTTGNVFFVDSGHANASDSTRNGKSTTEPFATIDFAVGQCTANNADYVVVMPGHTETVAAAGGLDLDVAGITLIGVGRGSDRPTINFTDTASDMDVDAANITMVNFLFTGGVDAIVQMIDVNAADFSLIDCETRDVTGQMEIAIGTDANSDRLFIDRHVHRGAAAAGGTLWLTIPSTPDGITVRDVWVDGNFSSGCIVAAGVTTNFSVYGTGQCFFRNRNAADTIVLMAGTATGNIGPNINARLTDDAANITEAFVGGDMQFFNPIRIVNADGEADIEWNGTASTDA